MGAPAYPQHQQQPFLADMDRAKDLVDMKAAELDSKLIQPASNAFKKASSEYPLATIFFTSFAILSIFPILAFIGFAVCATSVVIATALLFVTGWLAVIVGSAAVILAMVLAVTIATSLTITGGIAGAVVIYKLVINIKTTGAVREGVKLTVTEVKQYFNVSRKEQLKEDTDGYRISTLPMPENKHINGHHRVYSTSSLKSTSMKSEGE